MRLGLVESWGVDDDADPSSRDEGVIEDEVVIADECKGEVWGKNDDE